VAHLAYPLQSEFNYRGVGFFEMVEPFCKGCKTGWFSFGHSLDRA